ncbi:hypothetical protein HCN44_001003 [Aphidius gifuensis]|uniref:Uncharacterized protein n=1 Tax=Aphidius gifuensis TaxID=684658 RepID=A0A835CPU0_APHGI|nr:hypothetical protein HCN44_001003 [Aphidius gifuensis]
MVSMNPSYDVEQFKSAYENIRLFADNTWSNNRKNNYCKLNQILWIQSFKINKYFDDNDDDDEKSIKYVSDIIPNSKLSIYGNYKYNLFRESYYKKPTKDENNKINKIIKNNDKPSNEPWLYNEVEELFNKLTSKNLNISNKLEENLQLKINQESIRSMWIIKKKTSTETMRLVNCFRCKKSHQVPQNCKKKGSRCRYEEVCNIHHTVIISKNRYKGKDSKSSNNNNFNNSYNNKLKLPILSPEVPEFFPKTSIYTEQFYESVPLQYFPSLTDKIYQRIPIQNVATVFQHPGIPLLATPIITPIIRSSPQQWIPGLTTPLQIQMPICAMTNQQQQQQQQTFTSIQSSICSIPMIHRPIQIQEKIIQPNQLSQHETTQIPVYQRPQDQYNDQQYKKSCGVDFNNLILLTKNTMKIRNYQSKGLNYDKNIVNDLTKKIINFDEYVNNLENCDSKLENNNDNNSTNNNKTEL